MPRVFDEGRLRFEFDDSWEVEQYDKHVDYTGKIQKLHTTKAVDFTGAHKNTLFLVEVKDFRARRIENRDRLDGPLWEEVALKVRDTIGGLVGAHRMSASPDQWEGMVKCLADRRRRLRVVLWFEDDTLRTPVAADARAAVFTKALKPKLAWLTTHVLVVTTKTYREAPPDLRVTNLPGAAGHAHLHGPARRL